jgi:AcrR family transcriptional regulator
MLSANLRQTDHRAPPLSKADWLDMALRVLVDDGIEAVQITRLSRALEVTRGSFYWHFRDRGDLLAALIDEWRTRNTGVMAAVLEGSASLTEGILSLFIVWVDDRRFDPSLDQAMRDWARRSEVVRQIVIAEDDARVETICAFFRRFGYDETEAYIRARVIYFTQLSYYALGVEEPMTRRMGFLDAYFRCFTGREMDSATAEAFRREMTAEGATR